MSNPCKVFRVPISLLLEAENESDAYDTANEILRPCTRDHLGDKNSCVIDYSVGNAELLD